MRQSISGILSRPPRTTTVHAPIAPPHSVYPFLFLSPLLHFHLYNGLKIKTEGKKESDAQYTIQPNMALFLNSESSLRGAIARGRLSCRGVLHALKTSLGNGRGSALGNWE